MNHMMLIAAAITMPLGVLLYLGGAFEEDWWRIKIVAGVLLFGIGWGVLLWLAI